MYTNEFELAKRLILEAYDRVIKDSSREVIKKPDNSLVTKLDTETEEYITNGILEVYSTDNFLTEEYHSNGELMDRTWVIDPIDGTTNFSNNIPLWSIQLAFYDKGRVRFSIMYFPELNEMYSAVLGQGVYLNDTKLEYNIDEPSDKRIVQYIGGFKRYIDELVPVYKLLVDYCQSQRYNGGASFGYASILGDKCNTLVSYKQDNPWDELPGDFMCEELGLHIVNCDCSTGKLKIYTRSSHIKDIFSNFKV